MRYLHVIRLGASIKADKDRKTRIQGKEGRKEVF